MRVRAIKRPRKATIDRGTIAGSRWLIAITITCTLWLLIKSWPTSNLADTHSRSIFEKEREEGERKRKKGKDRLTEETRVGWNLIPEGVPSLDICQSVVGSINKLIAYTCRLLVHRRHASRFSTDSLFFLSLHSFFPKRDYWQFSGDSRFDLKKKNIGNKFFEKLTRNFPKYPRYFIFLLLFVSSSFKEITF